MLARAREETYNCFPGSLTDVLIDVGNQRYNSWSANLVRLYVLLQYIQIEISPIPRAIACTTESSIATTNSLTLYPIPARLEGRGEVRVSVVSLELQNLTMVAVTDLAFPGSLARYA